MEKNKENECALALISLVETIIQITKKVNSYHEINAGEDIMDYYKTYLTDYNLAYKMSAYIVENGLKIKLSYDEDNFFTECDEETINQILESFNIEVEFVGKNVIVYYSKIDELEISNSFQKHI